MEKEKFVGAGMNLLYLVECVLDGTSPERAAVESMDPEQLYLLAEKQHITAITAAALERADYGLADADTRKKFQECRQLAVRRAILFDAERAAILQEMEKAGIWYLPMKGCILKDFYPGIGLREMSDNDILFDETRAEDLRTIMINRGYRVEKYGKTCDDVYQKEPFYNFEMHRALFNRERRNKYNGYYDDLSTKLQPDGMTQYGRCFSDEDFYVYFMAHAYKHYSNGGIGLRFLVDCRVFLEKKRDEMDWEYIVRECGKIGITSLEELCRNAALKIIEQKDDIRNILWTQEEQIFLTEMTRAGAYGNTLIRAEKNMRQFIGDSEKITGRTKVRYFFRRLFPTVERMKIDVPFIWRTKIFIPAYFVFRIFRALIFKRGILKGDFMLLGRKESE